MSQIKTKFIENLAVTNAKVATGIDATKIADGSVTNAEFQYLGGVTSDIQTQINGKANTALSNLASTAINQDLIPNDDGTINLGSATFPYFDVRSYNTLTEVVKSPYDDRSIEMTSGQVKDSTAIKSLNFQSRRLYNAVDVQTLDWSGSVLSANVDIVPATDISIYLGSDTKQFVGVYTTNVISNASNLNLNAGNSIINLVGDEVTPVQIRFNDLDVSNYISIRAPNTVATDYSLVLPAAQGGASTVLQNDGSGNLSWASVSGGANTTLSNLTSPTAINQDLLMTSTNTLRVLNDVYIKARNAANSADLNILKAKSNDETQLLSPAYRLDSFAATWWAGDVIGLIKDQSSGAVDTLALATTDHATDSTNVGAAIFIGTGAKPGAASTGDTNGIFIISGANEGSGNSGQIYNETGIVDSGDSGSIENFTGDSATGASGQQIIQTGEVTGGAADSGRILLRTGNVGGSGKAGDLEIALGVTGVQGNIRTVANLLQIPNHASAPTLNLVDGGMYWNTTSDQLFIYDATATAFVPVIGAPAVTNNKATTTLNGTDITNQYIDLAHVAVTGSIIFMVQGSGYLIEGASYDYSVNYTGGAGGNTRITFLNDLATGGSAALIAGDVVQVQYQY